MKRRAYWDKILTRKIRDSYTKVFSWGTTDCVKWSFDVVDALVEESVTPPVEWSNKEEALALLATKSLTDRMSEIFGNPQPIGKTMRGDFVYVEDFYGGPTLGIAAGDKAVFISSKGGIITKNLLECNYSWSID